MEYENSFVTKKVPIALTSPEDWFPWIAHVERIAACLGVWDLITPYWTGTTESTREPEKKPALVEPTLEAIFNNPSISIKDLDDNEYARFMKFNELYDRINAHRKSQDESIVMVYLAMYESLPPDFRHITATEMSVRVILQDLKNAYEPSRIDRVQAVHTKWQQLQRKP
ncbi:hypothetical protein N7454_001665 [Penicillium verhagenii]|nr:hypothetical protein N7454_001665 [Penicillium verhagenii]